MKLREKWNADMGTVSVKPPDAIQPAPSYKLRKVALDNGGSKFVGDDEEGWKTVHGTHIQIGSGGRIEKGPAALKQYKPPVAVAQTTSFQASESAVKSIKQPVYSPTDEKLHAIRRYQDYEYQEVNDYLRHGGASPDAQETADALRTTLANSKTTKPMTTYRVVGGGKIGSELLDTPIGGVFESSGFVSTSTDQKYVQQFASTGGTFKAGGHVTMQIDIPVGSKALNMRAYTKSSNANADPEEEKEVLLDHRQKFEVVAVDKQNRKVTLRLKQ
jgi:hypothetical protein